MRYEKQAGPRIKTRHRRIATWRWHRVWKENSVKHTPVAPHQPCSNSQAQRFVQTFEHFF